MDRHGTRLLSLGLCGGLAACVAGPPGSGEAGDTAGQAAFGHGALAARAYRCENGMRLVAEPEGAERLYVFFPASNVELQRLPSASGARYTGAGGVEFWSRDRGARVVTPQGQTLTCEEDRLRSLIEDARLRGVDFWATGNEPGWRLEIGPRRTTLESGYGARTLRFPARAIEASLTRQAPVTLTLESQEVKVPVTLEPRHCRDDMSGRAFDWRVRLELEGRTLRGCGVALH